MVNEDQAPESDDAGQDAARAASGRAPRADLQPGKILD